MKRILLFLLVTGNISCLAQIKNYTIQLGTNYTLIGDVFQQPQARTLIVPSTSGYSSMISNADLVKHSFDGKFGFNVSGRFDYILPGKVFITSGLTLNFYQFKYRVVMEPLDFNQPMPVIPYLNGRIITQAGTPMGSMYVLNQNPEPFADPILGDGRIGNTQAWYLQIPVMAGKAFYNNKLIIRSGLTISMALHASEYRQKLSWKPGTPAPTGGTWTISASYTPTLTESRVNITSDFTTLSAGAILQGTFMFTKHLGIDLTAQRSFSRIYTSETPSVKPVYNTFSLGASYTFTR